MTLRVIQLTSSSCPAVTDGHGYWDSLSALCDDGSIWHKSMPADMSKKLTRWRRVLDIPQEPAGDDINF